MATQKKSTSKKAGTSSKSKKDLTPNSDTQGFGSIIGGWALVAFGLFLALGCFCSVYSGESGGFLGPYLGKMFPNGLAYMLGRVASVVAAGAMVLVAVHELIPECQQNQAEDPYLATMGIVAGFATMMLLDVALG